jgi:biofilm PGA synthesis N-glycosyltransferase PgaC
MSQVTIAALDQVVILGCLFWTAVGIIGYTYLGYPSWLWVHSRYRPRPVWSGPFLPSISIIIVVRNEEPVLERKLKNLMKLDYPPDLTEILMVSDGSIDGTNRILSKFATFPRVRAILNHQQRGKAAGLNDAINATTGEIVVFMDARQKIETGAVRLLLENFADPYVGCASGQLMLGDPDSGESVSGMGLYWKVEKTIREMESVSGSVVGATGAFYAVRRSLLVQLPPETILDDVYIPLHVLRQQGRVVFDPRALIWDRPSLGMEREFAQKVRTLSGNYQLLKLAPWILSRANPVRFGFVSHKLIRLFVPFALTATFVSSCLLRHPMYRFALFLQVTFYALSALALVRPKWGILARVADAAFTFVLLNAAAVVAFANFVTGRKVAWGTKRKRGGLAAADGVFGAEIASWDQRRPFAGAVTSSDES